MKPARVLFLMRGRLVPLGSFSSDVLSIVWEFMGGNVFIRAISSLAVINMDYAIVQQTPNRQNMA
jgi:hypothetical protein